MARALWPAGIALAIAAEWIGRPALPVLDATTGLALIALGLLGRTARPRLEAGALMVACGFAWFLGTLTPWAVDLHRAPLAQLIVTYPGTPGHTRVRPLRLVAL